MKKREKRPENAFRKSVFLLYVCTLFFGNNTWKTIATI